LLSDDDKLALAKTLTVNKVSAGQRVYADEKIDEIKLIIKGKTGILNPEQ